MSTVEQQYFALLRAALWDTSVSIDGEIDWKAVMQMAGFHSNNVLIADVASRMTEGSKPSPEMLAKMQSLMRNNLFHLMQLKQVLVSSVKLLREHDIEPVVLKGFGLALLYPNPSLRQIGDIDLFIGIDSFHKACTLLRTLPGSYNWGEEIDSGRHYNIEFGNIPLEVHRVSADIEDVKLPGCPVHLPDSSFNGRTGKKNQRTQDRTGRNCSAASGKSSARNEQHEPLSICHL